jgi:hypothetical protein
LSRRRRSEASLRLQGSFIVCLKALLSGCSDFRRDGISARERCLCGYILSIRALHDEEPHYGGIAREDSKSPPRWIGSQHAYVVIPSLPPWWISSGSAGNTVSGRPIAGPVGGSWCSPPTRKNTLLW